MRLFVALDIPEAVRDALGETIRQFEKRFQKICPGARWVRMAGAHVTLKFIGEVSAEKAEQIRASLRNVAVSSRPLNDTETDPISLHFAGLGFFPSPRRPRVLWVGVEASPALANLARAIEANLAPLGIAAETRPFSPHITLARFKSPEGLEPLRTAIEKNAPSDFGRAIVEVFHLYRSILKPTGAEYTRLETYTLSQEQAS